MKKNENTAENQARAQLDSILEMMKARDKASGTEQKVELEEGYPLDADEITECMQENALSVETRSGWTMHPHEMTPEEFRIVLCTGGPHVEIKGTLGEYSEPDSASLYFQDWGTPLTKYTNTTEEEDADLLQYCTVFYFGE